MSSVKPPSPPSSPPACLPSSGEAPVSEAPVSEAPVSEAPVSEAPQVPSGGVDRRTALQGLGALLAGCASGAPSSPGSDYTVLDSGQSPAPEFGWELLRERIDTVVVLMMENRSFDHYLGALSLVEGRSDVAGLTEAMSNPHPDGTDVHVFPSGIYCLSDPPHSWGSSHDQWNLGANDGFVREFYDRHPEVAHEAMGFFDRDSLVALYHLADHYTVCDQWFSSVMSSTWPNRFYASCGQNGGQNGNDFPDAPFDSIYTRLAAEGHTWGCYFNNAPFLVLLPDRAPNEPEFQPVERFFDDAAAGRLPNVVVVDPVFGRNDDHPPAHPVAGQVYIAQIYEALRASPQWERTLFIVTYDEHGGFFDHVPPPTLPDDRAADGFDQAGFRVPTVVVGPWVRPGHVSHTVRDHTSILAFIENLFELDALTTRDAAADPLLDLFDAEALVAGTPRAGAPTPTIYASEAELYAPECQYEVSFFTERGGHVTLQPELEDWLDAHAAGSPIDRRHLTDDLYAGLLERAERSGVLQRVGRDESPAL